jgi:LacI family transcriptional regulator
MLVCQADYRTHVSHRIVIFAPGCIARAVDYINQNACRGIRAEHVAKEMGYISQQDFDRNFKKATGRTPGEAILERQLQDARRWLLETEFSIAFIGGNCGFPSQRCFSRAFRAAEGRSPSEFRRRARNGQPHRRRLALPKRRVDW